MSRTRLNGAPASADVAFPTYEKDSTKTSEGTVWVVRILLLYEEIQGAKRRRINEVIASGNPASLPYLSQLFLGKLGLLGPWMFLDNLV